MSKPEIVQQLRIPIRPDADAVLYIPVPMTEEDWDQFMAVLGAMKPGLVPAVAPEASEVRLGGQPIDPQRNYP